MTAHQSLPVTLGDGAVWQARLLVAADGARSRVRERAGIASHGWSYNQSAIVTTVAHERDHHGRAEEHFLPSGPFAICRSKGNARRSCGRSARLKRRASSHSIMPHFTTNLSGASA